jgi:hypothetical protein
MTGPFLNQFSGNALSSGRCLGAAGKSPKNGSDGSEDGDDDEEGTEYSYDSEETGELESGR